MTTPCDKNSYCPGCDKVIESTRDNQPGLSAIAYRLGTHGEFFQRMLGLLHTEEVLRKQLTTRGQDDFAIAILDAWAVVGDVLSFYQERIANEGFLRTATERRSILEIARTLGYELNPGVAAGTYLAFFVDSTNPAYSVSDVPVGTQAQSIPAPGEVPKTFETDADFEAHLAWNELKPRQNIPQILGIKGPSLFSLCLRDENDSGTDSISNYYIVNSDSSLRVQDNIKAVEVNQIYLKGTANNLKTGDIILIVAVNSSKEKTAILRTIVKLATNKELDRTDVYFEGIEAQKEPNRLARMAHKSSSRSPSIPTGLEFKRTAVEDNILNTVISEQSLQALVEVNKWDLSQLNDHIREVQNAAASVAEDQGVFALREHLGFFGNNAPQWNSLPVSQRYDHYYDYEDGEPGELLTGEPVYDPNWDDGGWSIWKKYPNRAGYYCNFYAADVFLERIVEGIGQNSWVVFNYPSASSPFDRQVVYKVTGTIDQSLTGFSLSGKATGLRLVELNGALTRIDDMLVRRTSAHVKSESLTLVDLPVDEDLKEETRDSDDITLVTGVSYLMLDGFVTGLQIGQSVIVNGERVDAPGIICHEVAVLKNIVHVRGYTVLYFKEHLQYQYLRETVVLNANVVPATHGETINDVLGSGVGVSINQDFILKKPPLTYVSAATPSGSESTLAVKVDNIEWEQASSLYNLGPRSQSYIVRLTNEGKVHVKFGDGKQGARLPTGQENITATYRSGIGSEGEVGAESIKLLKARPAGIKKVTNLLPATGAQSPETLDNARQNAPRTVLIMDRIVSLQDYEDFTRAYAGIGKAQAVVLWNGVNELVHITAAGASGETIEYTSETYLNLCDSIDNYRDRLASVQVDSFDLRLFQLEAKLLIDKNYDSSAVLTAATAALQEAFAFASRDFGQPVTSAEVITILQETTGVIAVDLDKMYLTDSAYKKCRILGPTQKYPAPVLPSSKAHWPLNKPFQKAQLLLINPVGITLKEMLS